VIPERLGSLPIVERSPAAALRKVQVENQPRQDNEHLRLLAIFHYVVAALMAAWGSFPIIHMVIGAAMVLHKLPADKPGNAPPDEFIGWMFLLMGGAFVVVGWGMAIATAIAGRSLTQRRHYMYCMIVAGLMTALCMPFGTVLGVFTIIVLIRPSVKQTFGQVDV